MIFTHDFCCYFAVLCNVVCFVQISDDEDDYLPQSQFVRESGLGSQHYSLNLDLNPDSTFEVVETQDNVDILYNIKDLKRELVNKWLPTVAKWLEVQHFSSIF